MAFVAELTLTDPVLFGPTFEAVPRTECTLEDVHYVVDEQGATRYVVFWWVTGCRFTEYERALAGDPSVSEFREITEVGNRRLYRVTTRRVPPEQPLIFPLFREHDVTELETKRTAEGLHVEARFPSRGALRTFRRERDARIVIERLYTETAPSEPTELLTEKQRAALSLATDRGYFETPAEVTLEALGAECDVSPQMLSRHLRAAVKELVEREVLAGRRGI